MKKFISFILIFAFALTVCPLQMIADAESENEIYSAFSQYEVYSDTIDDGYIGIPVLIHTYIKGESTSSTPIVTYIVNHQMERVGTEDDISIISDLLEEYIVIVIDYQNSPLSVSPDIDWSILGLQQKIKNKSFLNGNPAMLTYGMWEIYTVPSGCRIVRDILYFELDKHAPNGTIPYIIDVWNTYYAGKKTDNNGNLLPAAEKIEDCIKKDGTPIDLDLKLDIVYPSKPKTTVPVFMLAASSETRTGTHLNARRPHYTGFLMRGYAGVCYDHEYIPMSRNDHYGYLDSAFSLYKYTANRSHSAAVRRVKQLADVYGYNADYVGTWGFSKSSTGPAILSDTTHLEKGEISQFEEKYTNGLDPTQSPKEQPWLTYDDGTPVSSNVTVTYSGSGPGFHNHIFFTAPKSRETAVPLLNSSGTEDTTGGFYKLWPAVYNEIEKRDLESLVTDIVGLDHTYPITFDERRDIDMYTTYIDFFDNQIRSKYRKEPPLVLWTTPCDKTSFDTVNVPVEVKFTRAMDVDSVKSGVKVINESTGEAVDGNWTIHNGNTRFLFESYMFEAGTKYRIEVTKECMAEDGVYLAEEMVKRFKINGTETLDATKDAYILNTSPDANYGSEDTVNVFYDENTISKGYIGFERDGGFSDVSKATLLIKGSDADFSNSVYGINDSNWDESTITWNNAPANDTSSSGFASDKVYGGKEIGTVFGESLVASIDVTDYIKSVGNGEKATFGIASPKKTKLTLSYDFEGITSADFKENVHYRWGGGTSKGAITSEEARSGTQSFKFYNRAYTYSRIKFYNCINENGLTDDDIGDTYLATMYVKSPVKTAFNLGVFSGTTGNYATGSYINTSIEGNANEWTKLELKFTIDKEMVDNNVQFMGIETSTIVDTIYIDDFNVKLASDKNEIVSKEGKTLILPSARLLIDTSDGAVSHTGDNAYVQSGEKADTNLSSDANIYVKGADSFITSGAQKGYLLIPLAGVDTASSVNLKFTTNESANQTICVYGVDGGELRKSPAYSTSVGNNFVSAQNWDNTITWNSAFANDKTGAGILSSFAYGGSPIAEVDCLTAGEKSVDVTEFAKAMKESGAENATFVLTAKKQGSSEKKIDFTNTDRYSFSLSYTTASFSFVDGERYDNSNGKLLYFKRSGTDSTNGYNETVSIGGLIKSSNEWTSDDIGKTYNISFRVKAKTDGDASTYNHTFIAAVTRKNSGTLSNLLGGNSDTAKAIGTAIVKSHNADSKWYQYSLTFTVTEDMVNNYKDYTYLTLSGYKGSAEMWFDDISVKQLGDSVTVSSGSSLFKGYNFNTETDLTKFALSHSSNSEVSIAKNAGWDGTDCLLFNKLDANYNYALTIPNLMTSSNKLTSNDVGKRYKISFKYKPVHNAGNSCTVLYRMGVNKSSNGTANALSTELAFQKGSLTSGSWYDAEFTFTLTSDMVSAYPYRCELIIGSFGATQQIYIDDIKSELISGGPHLEVIGEDLTSSNNNLIVGSVIKASEPTKSFSHEEIVIKREDYIDGVYGSKKSYLSFDVSDPYLIKSAYLKLNILNSVLNAGQTIDVYALNNNASYDKNTITWNNAPANNIYSNSMLNSFMYGGAKLTSIDASSPGQKQVDVTQYVKSLSDNSKAVFALATNDASNAVIYERNFEDGEAFTQPRDVRYGGQDNMVAIVKSEQNGNKYLELSNIKYNYSRVRFVNVFGVPYFTSADKGTKYKISFAVKPESDTKIYSGGMSIVPDKKYSNGSSSATNIDPSGGMINYVIAPANVWTDFEFTYTVNDESVTGMVNSLSIGQSEKVGTTSNEPASKVLCIDNIKVEKIMGAYEVSIDKNAKLDISNDIPDTTADSAEITRINSSGSFNNGDSVIINMDTDTSFKNTVTDVVFYVNGEPYAASGSKGSSYSLRLLNLAQGSYTVYGKVTFSNGETVTSNEKTFDISSGTSYSEVETKIRGSLVSNSGYTVTKRIKSNIKSNVNGKMIVAIYDAKDNLVNVIKGNSQVLGAGEVNDFTVSVQNIGKIPEGSYAKIMIWTDLEDMLPLVASEIAR